MFLFFGGAPNFGVPGGPQMAQDGPGGVGGTRKHIGFLEMVFLFGDTFLLIFRWMLPSNCLFLYHPINDAPLLVHH